MNDLFIYLLKVSGGLGIIFLPYYFIFRNDPNLGMKRFYLVTGLIAAWVFPLIAFRRPDILVNLTPMVFIDPLDNETGQVFTGTGSTHSITVHWFQVLVLTYLTGVIFLLLKNLFIILKWNHTWSKTKSADGITFTRNNEVFTIFTKIFIPGKLQYNQDLDNVLLHEKAHVQQLHFIDLTMMELTLLLTWFNPFSWLISRMIKENHEHLADRQVLSAGVNPARYRAQLLNYTLGVNVFRLGSQFNHSLTLKRFNMMKKPKKSPKGILKIALLIPAVLLTLGLTVGMTPPQKTIKGKVVLAESGEPVPGASVVIKGTTSGTVTDRDGSFMLNIDGDPHIVISFVGYSNIDIKASKIKNKPLKLEQKVFMVNLDSTPVHNSEKEVDKIHIRPSDDPEKEPVFFIVENMPMYPGGKSELKNYIYSHVKYPEVAKSKGISGEVFVQFIVSQTGKLEDITVARSTNKAFEQPSLEVFKNMPDWNPGSQRGKPVKVQVIVPVKFKPDVE